MSKQQFFKGLFMVLISVLITGFSTSPINLVLIGITALASVLPYVVKNLIDVLNSNSQPGEFNFVNIISVLLIGIGTGFVDWLGQYITGDPIVWPVLWKVVIYTTGTYFLATLFSPPNSTSPKMFK